MMDAGSAFLNTDETRWGLMPSSEPLTSEEAAAINAVLNVLYPPPIGYAFSGWYFTKGKRNWCARKISWEAGFWEDTLDKLLAHIIQYENE